MADKELPDSSWAREPQPSDRLACSLIAESLPRRGAAVDGSPGRQPGGDSVASITSESATDTANVSMQRPGTPATQPVATS